MDDRRHFTEQVQEILVLVNVMKGSNITSQLAKEGICLFRIFLGAYRDSIDGYACLCSTALLLFFLSLGGVLIPTHLHITDVVLT